MSHVLKRLVLALGILLLAAPVHAQPTDSVRALWQEGTQAYAQGRYQQATEAYRQVIEAGFESGALHYNLGNAYYRLEEIGEAVRHYEKAKRFRPRDDRIEHNLDMVRSQFDALSGTVPAPGWTRLVAGWPITALFWVGLIVYATGFLTWSWFRATSRLPNASPASPVARRLSLAATAGGLLIVLLAGTAGYAQTLDRRAVVLVEQTSLQAEPSDGIVPDPTAGTAGTTPLIEGTIVRLRATRSGWTRVTTPDGETGWIPTPALGEI
jgi:tetratricopeptide (TPR) repeat protein